MYLRDACYVASMESELADRPLPVKILNERIVLYRRSNGDPAALEDACVHRKLPLSMGRIRGDNIECGYHGLTFDAAGKCVRIPCADRIPPAARVRSYPLVSQEGFADTQSPHIDIAIDSAPLRFRRRLRQLIAAEAPADSNAAG